MFQSLPAAFRNLALFALVALLGACATTAEYNPTTFPFEMEQERLAGHSIKTVVIPHVNLGPPSRSYLEAESSRIDGFLAEYLKENGFKVIPQREFEQRWNLAVRSYGDPVDPTTGRLNIKTFSLIMESLRDEMVRDFDLDAFVFTDLVEVQVAFSGGLKHLARWDGVTRKPPTQGTGNSVSADFDWGQLATAASLQVAIFDRELQRVFFSRGGLDATEAVDTRSGTGFVRLRNMLDNESFVEEGVQLAMHPLIPMEDWPGNP